MPPAEEKDYPGAFVLVTLSIALAEFVTMTMLVSLNIIPPFTPPRYVIPLSGMIIGNAW